MRADSFSHAYIAAWRSGLFILGFVFRIFFFVVLFGSVLERLAKRKKIAAGDFGFISEAARLRSDPFLAFDRWPTRRHDANAGAVRVPLRPRRSDHADPFGCFAIKTRAYRPGFCEKSCARAAPKHAASQADASRSGTLANGLCLTTTGPASDRSWINVRTDCDVRAIAISVELHILVIRVVERSTDKRRPLYSTLVQLPFCTRLE